jgi:hypothetical protein
LWNIVATISLLVPLVSAKVCFVPMGAMQHFAHNLLARSLQTTVTLETL